MSAKCECVQVCLDNPDKNFEQLIEMGLICERCANSYKEFCKIIGKEEKGLPEILPISSEIYKKYKFNIQTKG